MKKIFLITSTMAMLLLSGCTTTGPKTTADISQKGAEVAIATAEARYNEAKKEGIAWRKTHEIIAKAKEMAKESKFKEAIALAETAKLESDTAIQESSEYQKAVNEAVIK
jgi:argininosuccinate lyase